MAISNNSTGLRPGVCTSTTRPTAPYEGQMIYETDTDLVLVWDNAAWLYSATPQTTEPGARQTWTPTYTNLTIGNGTVTSDYTIINRLVHFEWRLLVGSTTSSSGPMRVSLPVNILRSYMLFLGLVRTVGVTTTAISGEVNDGAANAFTLRSSSSGALGNLTLPAANTEIIISGTYFSAS